MPPTRTPRWTGPVAWPTMSPRRMGEPSARCGVDGSSPPRLTWSRLAPVPTARVRYRLPATIPSNATYALSGEMMVSPTDDPYSRPRLPAHHLHGGGRYPSMTGAATGASQQGSVDPGESTRVPVPASATGAGDVGTATTEPRAAAMIATDLSTASARSRRQINPAARRRERRCSTERV